MDKKEIRKLIAAKKSALRQDEIDSYSERLSELFAAQEVYRNADVIYAYLAYNEEIRTEGLIRRAWADGKRVAVPKVLSPSEGRMEFFYIDSFDGIAPGYYDIPEPDGDPRTIADEAKVLLLMPGLAFGRDRNRIGYGGGFYDRYLERKEAEGVEFFKAALAYEFQIFDTIPAQSHDRKLDMVLSVSEII